MESMETGEDFLSDNSLLYDDLENCDNTFTNNSPCSEISNLDWHSILEQKIGIKSELVSPLLSPCGQPHPLSGVSSPLSLPLDGDPQDEPPSLASPATPVASIMGSASDSAPTQSTADLFHKTLYQCQYCKRTFEPLAIVHHQITCTDLIWMRPSSRCRQVLPFRLHMEAEPVGTFRKAQLGQRRPAVSKKRRSATGVRRAATADAYVAEMSLPDEDSGSNSTNCTPVKGLRGSVGCKSVNVQKCSVNVEPFLANHTVAAATLSDKSTKSSRRKRHEIRSARLVKPLLPALMPSRVNNTALTEPDPIVLEISPSGAGSDSGSDSRRRRLLPPPPLTSEDDICPEPIVTGTHALLPGQEDDSVSDHHFHKKHSTNIDNCEAPPSKVARQMSPPNLENDADISVGSANATDCLNHVRPQLDSSMFVSAASSFQPLSIEASEYPVIHLPDRPSPQHQLSLFRQQQPIRSPVLKSLSPVFTEDWQAQWPPTYKHLWRYIMSDRENLASNVNVPEGFVANVLERYFHDEVDTAVRRLSPVGGCASNSLRGSLPMRLAEAALQRYLERRQWLACRLGNPSLARTRFRSTTQLDPCYRGRRFGELLPPEYFLFPNTPAHEADEYVASGERVRLIGRPPYVHVAGAQQSQMSESQSGAMRGSSSSMECSPPFSDRPTRKRSRGHNSGTKIVPIKDRVYNPDEHCGVCITKDEHRLGANSNSQHCLRSLTCKTHTLTQRRAVPGRTEDLSVLLDRNKMQRLIRSQRLGVCKNEVGDALESTAFREQLRRDAPNPKQQQQQQQQQHRVPINKLRRVGEIVARGAAIGSPEPPNLEHYPSLEQVEERFIHRGVLPDAHSGPQVDLCAAVSVSRHQVRSASYITPHPFAVDPQMLLLHPPHPSTPDSTKSSKCSTDEAEEFGNGSGVHFSYPPSLPITLLPQEAAPPAKRPPTIVLKFNHCVAQSLCRRGVDRYNFLSQRRRALTQEKEHKPSHPSTLSAQPAQQQQQRLPSAVVSSPVVGSFAGAATSLLLRRKTTNSLDQLQPYVQKVKCLPSAAPSIMPITSAVSLTSASALVNVSSSYNAKELAKERIVQLAATPNSVQPNCNVAQLQRRVGVRSVTVLPGGNHIHPLPPTSTYSEPAAQYLNQQTPQMLVKQQVRLRQPSPSIAVKDAKHNLMQQQLRHVATADGNARMVRLQTVARLDDNGCTSADYSAFDGLRLHHDMTGVVKHASAQQVLLPKPTGAYQFLSHMPSTSSAAATAAPGFTRFSGVHQMSFAQQRQTGYATTNRPSL